MKRHLLILTSAAAVFAPSLRTSLATANAPASPSDELVKTLGKLGVPEDAPPDVVNAAIVKLIDAANPAAITARKDELGLGPLQLPSGLDAKDVAWRRRAGLDTKQAVQAALMQKRHDDAVGKEKAKRARTAQVPAAALFVAAHYSDEGLKHYATGLKGFNLNKDATREEIIKAIDAYNAKLAKEEKANA